MSSSSLSSDPPLARWRRYIFAAFLSLLLFVMAINIRSCMTSRLCANARFSPRADYPRVRHDVIHDDISHVKPVFALEDLGFYFYMAYLDSRQVAHSIRVLGILRNDSDVHNIWCNWNSTKGILWQVKATCEIIDRNWPLHNKYFAFMMTCELPEGAPTEVTIAVASHSVLLPVHQSAAPTSQRDTLAVCVKPITGQFPVSRVIEWVELHLAAGYRHFILYDTDLQGPSRYVLEFYKGKGIVEILRFPFLMSVLELIERKKLLGGELRYALYQQVYLVALHDCIFRFHSKYKYLAMVDLDEIILPAKNVTMSQLMDRLQLKFPDVVSYVFYTYWHFQEFSTRTADIPDYLYMQMTARAPPPTLDQPKSIVRTDLVRTVNWHGVLEGLDRSRPPRYLLSYWNDASVHHFRDGTCADHFHQLCPNMTSSAEVRPDVRRYRRVTERRVRAVLDYLQI